MAISYSKARVEAELAEITEALETLRAESREHYLNVAEINPELSKNEMEEIRIGTHGILNELREHILENRDHYYDARRDMAIGKILTLIIAIVEVIILAYNTTVGNVIVAIFALALSAVGYFLSYRRTIMVVYYLVDQYVKFGELEAVITTVDYRGLERNNNFKKPVV